MPTPTQLRAEIESGPLSAEVAPLFAAARDADAAAALNRRDRTGYVPARHVLATLLSDTTGLGAGLAWAWRHGEMLDGSPVPSTLRVLLARLFLGTELTGYAIKFPPAELVKGLAATGASAELGAALFAGEVKISRAEELGWAVTDAAVADARKAAKQ